MSLQAPRLDDRRFQDIVDELKSRIPLYCPEWTDHNVSDPGVTLIELFAYMAEQLLYRMNRLPELHYLKFVEFLGIPIPTPQPARVPITFWLTKPLTMENDNGTGVSIDAGTQVATTQTETAESVLFSIEQRHRIVAPILRELHKDSSDGDGEEPTLNLLALGEGVGSELFSSRPRRGDSFYFYFENDISRHVLQFNLAFADKLGTAIEVDKPPIIWEAYTDRHEWERIEEVEDGTSGFNKTGTIQLHLPKLTRMTSSRGRNWYGLRVKVESEEYGRSPRLRKIEPVASLGRTIEAVHLQEEENEFLGVSDGSPGQRFRLRHAPIILPLKAGTEVLMVGEEPNAERWICVENFAWHDDLPGTDVLSNGRYFTIDVTTNEVCLPPAIRRPNGELKLYGAIPPRDTRLSFSAYRHGGGAVELPSFSITELKTSIPYIGRVQNRRPASGGQSGLSGSAGIETSGLGTRSQEAITLDTLEIEVQRFLRSGRQARFGRVVTAEEFESLVLAEFPEEIGKVECRMETSDRVDHLAVYIMAKMPIRTSLSGELSPEVPAEVRQRVDEVLYKHRLLTARVGARSPRFVGLEVEIDLAGAKDEEIERRVQAVAAAYLNPIYGGDGGGGWRLEQRCTPAQLHGHLRLVFPELEIRTVRIESDEEKPETTSAIARLFLLKTCTVNFD